MSDYTKVYDGAAKDTAKSTVAGADFDVEFDAIETAVATKANKTGAETLTDKTIDFVSWSEKVASMATTGAVTLDLSAATYFYNTATTGSNTFTFSNPPTTGKVLAFTVELFGGLTHAPTWPASVEWSDGLEPTYTAGKDILTFFTRDGGTTYVGTLSAAGVA